MKRRPSPLAGALQARIRLLATTLRPPTVAAYRQTATLFLTYLEKRDPDLRQPCDLKRDPHLLSWFEYLWRKTSQKSGQPLRSATRAQHLFRLRRLFELLADHRHPPRPGLWLDADFPRPDQLLPRPLAPQHDAALQSELRRNNDLLSHTLLLMRLTGMRIGECVDLAPDCLRHLHQDRWAVHVPLGKLHSERWVPVDDEVRTLLARLSFLRTLPPAAGPQFLLPRDRGRAVLCNHLRIALRDAAARAGISESIVPHQLRHTYATAMLRAGVSLPALMKLLGHRTANMTLRYVEITQEDLQREFHRAQQCPRYHIPVPPTLPASDPLAADAALVLDRLSAAIRVLDLYGQQHPTLQPKPLALLSRRLVRVRTAFKKFSDGAGDLN